MDWNEPLAVMLGTFLGVLSGIGVQIGVNLWSNRMQRRQDLKNVSYELAHIHMKLDEYIEKLGRYEERIEADNLRPASMYFDMGKVMAPTFHAMHHKGGLYRYLRHEDLNGVMIMGGKFSPGYEEYFNGEIRRVLQRGDRNIAQSRMRGWITELKRDRESLEVVMDRLQKFTPRVL